MAKKFNDLAQKTMSPESLKRAKNRKAKMAVQMALDEIRKSRHFSQTDVANLLEISQPVVSNYENNDDMLVSSLRAYLHAIGVDLKIIAKFPEGLEIEINQFQSEDRTGT